MFVQFKEKTFEHYFVSELSRKTKTFYCPDQIDELYLGFDAMFFVPHWRHFFGRGELFTAEWLRGITPRDVNLMGREFNRVFPDLKANLFFQFKRPQFLTKRTAKEWRYWQSPYFRFAVYDHQHKILIDLSHTVSNRARVLYAAPKLVQTKELITAAKNKLVIKNTQLVEASKLICHKKCTYTNTSNTVLGHSEPEELTTFSIESFLAEMASKDGENFTQISKRVGSEINEALADRSDAKSILHSARSIMTEGWSDEMPPEFQNTWLDHLITVRAFSKAFGISTHFLG